jgi:TPR repeat protein
VAFWLEACEANRVNGCENLASMYRRYCQRGSAWSCNELAVLSTSGKTEISENPAELFSLSCRGGLSAGCENATALAAAKTATHRGDPRFSDYVVVFSIAEPGPSLPVFTRACDEGFVAGCASVGDMYFQGTEVAKDQPRAREIWQQACDRGHAASCANLGVMSRLGDGVPKDDAKAASYMKRACDLGLTRACRLLGELNGSPLP